MVSAEDSHSGTPSCTRAGTRPLGLMVERKSGFRVSPAGMESSIRCAIGLGWSCSSSARMAAVMLAVELGAK